MSTLRVDTIASENAGDAVAFTKGINVTGTSTATTFEGTYSGSGASLTGLIFNSKTKSKKSTPPKSVPPLSIPRMFIKYNESVRLWVLPSAIELIIKFVIILLSTKDVSK